MHKRSTAGYEIQPLERRTMLAVAGTLDRTFSGDGKDVLKLSIDPAKSFFPSDAAVQTDGKTVVVGRYSKQFLEGGSDFCIVRYNVDGTLDSTFGGPQQAGVALFHLGKANEDSIANVVKIQPDGKILVAGEAYTDRSFAPDTQDFAIIRLNTNGTLDKTFSGDGKQVIEQDGGFASATGMALMSDGRILLGGYTINDDFDFALCRLKPDGLLDGTFSGDGKLVVGFGGDEIAANVAIDSAGNIVLIGSFDDDGVALLRLKSNGDADPAFGTKGRVLFKTPGLRGPGIATGDFLLTSDQKIIVYESPRSGGNARLLRFTAAGGLDTAFGGKGTGFAEISGMKFASAMIRAQDGGILVGGETDRKFVLSAFDSNGVPRTTFGNAGRVETDFGDQSGGIVALARGPGRRIFALGGFRMHAARYLETGANVVALGALDGVATEGTTDTAKLIVGRTERLGTPTRVFINVTGSASGPIGKLIRDYSIPGLVFPVSGSPFVDIPAGETFVVLPLTAKDDTAIEGRETVSFSIIPNATYEIGTPSKGEIDIKDNDSGTQVDLNGVTDSFVRDGDSANSNFSSSPELQVKTGGTGFNRFSYIKFDISSISTISSAKLNLSGKLVDTQSSSVGVSIFPVTDNNWTGPTITFNNRPTPGNTALASVNVVGTATSLYSFDVTTYVQQQKALGQNFVSFFLKAPTAAASIVSFNSGNAGSNTPKLSILSVNDSVGTFTATAPPVSAKVGQELQIAVKWDVPTGGWRQLSWIKLVLRDEEDGSFAVLKFEEATNSFYLMRQPGVANEPVALVANKSSFQAAGPTAPVVTTTFTFKFKDSAVGHKYSIEASARNDKMVLSGPSPIGAISVKPR